MMASTLGEQPIRASDASKEDQPEEDMEMDMDEDEEEKEEEQETQEEIEAKKKAAEAERAKEVQRKFAEQQGTMKIRKDYVPKGESFVPLSRSMIADGWKRGRGRWEEERELTFLFLVLGFDRI